MRLLFVADGRSPTAFSWIQHWLETGHETHLVSTFPCDPPPGLASFHILPVAFGGMAGVKGNRGSGLSHANGIIERFRGSLRLVRYLLGPLSMPFHQKRFRNLVEDIHPDIVHALRIPFEGMLASATSELTPLVISVWGNDLTLHAHGSPFMAGLTRRTLQRANGLIADAARDIRLGHQWGFSGDRPTLVIPGGGGIQLEKIDAPYKLKTLPEELPENLIVVNPRGQRPGSLRQDIFFQSIPLVLEKFPQAFFICPQLAGDIESENWVKRLRIGSNTKLWPHLEQEQLWSLYKKAQVFVSPSIHDGTPNSLLEAMAIGCFPVVGDIESMGEWVTTGVNGLLVDATSPRALSEGIIAALENPFLCETAKKVNARIITERAEYRRCMAMAEAFYQMLGRRIF